MRRLSLKSTDFGVDPESMKGKSKKSTYSTTFGVDPCSVRMENEEEEQE